MPSFGKKLKTEREKRAITLEQISSTTKIGTRMLQALEDENFDQLPGGIFNKGFVRAYARHVGLDEDQAVADYLQASGDVPSPQLDPKIEAQVQPPEPYFAPSRPIPWGWLAAALLILALALWTWSRLHRPFEPPPAAPDATNESATGSKAAAPSAPALVAPAKEVVSVPKPVPAETARSSTAPVTQPAAAPGEFTVVVLARDDSWLSIAVDGKAAVEETLAGENQRALHARSQVVIKAGNVGALDFVFNGQKLPSQGDYGDVKTLTFGPDGLEIRTSVRPATTP